MNGRLLQRVSNNSVQDRHDIPQLLSSTNIYLLGSHSSTRRNGNLHSEATPQTLVMEIWPPAYQEHTGLCGLHKTGDSASPILNQTQRKPCHKIDVSTCVLAEHLTFPQKKFDLYVVESMVCVEVGRSPCDHPSGTGSRMTKKYSMLVEHQYPGFFFVNVTFKKTKSQLTNKLHGFQDTVTPTLGPVENSWEFLRGPHLIHLWISLPQLIASLHVALHTDQEEEHSRPSKPQGTFHDIWWPKILRLWDTNWSNDSWCFMGQVIDIKYLRLLWSRLGKMNPIPRSYKTPHKEHDSIRGLVYAYCGLETGLFSMKGWWRGWD